jgi:hypothetical protein
MLAAPATDEKNVHVPLLSLAAGRLLPLFVLAVLDTAILFDGRKEDARIKQLSIMRVYI